MSRWSSGALALLLSLSLQSSDAFLPSGLTEQANKQVTRTFLFPQSWRKSEDEVNAESDGGARQIDPWDEEDAYTKAYARAQRHKMPSLLPDPPKCDTPESRSNTVSMENSASALWADRPRLDEPDKRLQMARKMGMPKALRPDVDDYYSPTFGNSAAPDYEKPKSLTPDNVLHLGRNQRNDGIPNGVAPDAADHYSSRRKDPASQYYNESPSLTPDDVLHLGGQDQNKAQERHHRVPGGLSPDPPTWDAPRNKYPPAPLDTPRSSLPDRPNWEGKRRPPTPQEYDRLPQPGEEYGRRAESSENYQRRPDPYEDYTRRPKPSEDFDRRFQSSEEYGRRSQPPEDNRRRSQSSEDFRRRSQSSYERGLQSREDNRRSPKPSQDRNQRREIDHYERPRMQPKMKTQMHSWRREDDIDEDDVDAALDFFMRKMAESDEFQHLSYEERIALAAAAVVEKQQKPGLMSRLLNFGKRILGRGRDQMEDHTYDY